MQGLRHQMSQGAANWTIDAGDRFTFYRLVDSVVPSTLDKDGHEKSFFDGIDTTWRGLAARDEAEQKLPQLRTELTEVAKLVAEATEDAKGTEISSAALPLMKMVAELKRAHGEVQASKLSAAAKLDLLTRIAEKQQQAETALNLALGVSLTAEASSGAANTAAIDQSELHPPNEADALTTVSPGQEFTVVITLHNGSKQTLAIDHIKLEVPAGWTTVEGKTKPETINAGENVHANFRLRVPKDAAYTRPYWHRDNPDTEAINHIDEREICDASLSASGVARASGVFGGRKWGGKNGEWNYLGGGEPLYW